ILNNGTHNFYPSTIVISLDGFHPHYVSETLTPYLHQLMTTGGGAPYMIPSFPSSTFPNHWTLVTGLYPNNHGIVGNQFYDPKLEKRFYNTRPAQSLDPVWWGGEPIWKTLQKNGITTAVHMWPGSEVNWGVYDPIIVDAFNGTETLENKSDRLVEWLDKADLASRPELMLAYVPNIDTLGHAYGVSGPELDEGMREVDAFVGRLLNAILDRNLTQITNIVVLSDHGMAPTSNDRLIYLDDMVDLSTIEYIDGWPLFGLRPNDTSSEGVQMLYDTLKSQEPRNDTIWSVYKKEDLPKEWHFGGIEGGPYASRVAPVWLVPSVGWSVTTHKTMEKLKGEYLPNGVHGYNNTEFLMRALFLAQGPFFGDSEDRLAPFENVNVYSLICKSLGIMPPKSDGKGQVSLKGLPKGWSDMFVDEHADLRSAQASLNATFDALYG
ncbi:Phosphodiest-domain-containing protein, partial [Nadsonia fulvescens var. elongata DSM 6958]